VREPREPGIEGEDWIVFTGAILVGAALLLSFVWAIVYDTGGRLQTQHVGPVPSGVTQLSDTAYLVGWSSGVLPEQFCQTNVNEDQGTPRGYKTRRRIPKLEADYVQCVYAQSFGISPKEPESKNLGEGFLNIWSQWWFWTGVGCFFFFVVIPWRWEWYKLQMMRWKRVQREREAIATYNMEEQKLREIVAAYSRYELSDSEYESGLERAYMAGVPKAE
jgi:hypothetical protein